jgi:protease-4
MYRRLMELRNRRGLPVVAIIEDVGASGGYYLACGADEILAHPTSVVGSIGVIVQTVSIAGTMQKLGIQSRAIVSGPFKDLASPFKPLRKEDLQILQGMVDDFYARFLAVVEAGRPKLTAEQVRQLADGRVYTAVQACENGLIDAAGYMPEAVQRAKALAGSERVRVVIYHRPWGYAPNAYAASPSPAARGPSTQINLLNVQAHTPWLAPQPRFLYLWTGHTHAPQR